MAINPVGGGMPQGPNKLQQVKQQVASLQKDDKQTLKQQLEEELKTGQAKPQQAQEGKEDLQKVQQEVSALKKPEKAQIKQQLDQEDKAETSQEAQQGGGGDQGGGGEGANQIGDMIKGLTDSIGDMAKKGSDNNSQQVNPTRSSSATKGTASKATSASKPASAPKASSAPKAPAASGAKK